PPAKYDAAGTGGVINIRLKHIPEKGLNGNLNLSYIQGEYGRGNGSLNLNLRQNKLNVAANFGYSLNNSDNDIHLTRNFDPAVISDIAPVFTQRSYVTHHIQNYSGRVTLDFYLTDKSTLGMVLSGVFTHGSNQTANESTLSDLNGQIDSAIVAH